MRNMHYGNFPLTFFYFLLFCILHTSKARESLWEKLFACFDAIYLGTRYKLFFQAALQMIAFTRFTQGGFHFRLIAPFDQVQMWFCGEQQRCAADTSLGAIAGTAFTLVIVYGTDLAKGLKHSPDSLMTSQLMQLYWDLLTADALTYRGLAVTFELVLEAAI